MADNGPFTIFHRAGNREFVTGLLPRRAARRCRSLAENEQMFEPVSIMTVGEIEIIRRSAAMASLSKTETFRLLDECDRLVRERAAVAALLADLPTSFGAVRKTLNDLQRLVG